MNIFETIKFKEVKIKGVVDLQIIDKKTNKVIDELHLENTETIQAQIFAGYLPGNVGFIFEDITQFLPGQDVAYIKKILWSDEINYKNATSQHKTNISNTQYEYSFSYNPDLGEETIYGIMIYGNPVQNPRGTNINVPFTLLILPNPITVNQDYAIVGKYTIYLDKAPYTFSTQVDLYHYENVNTIRTDFEIDVNYLLWYLENRTFIHPAGSNAWFGIEQAAVQSTGQVKINLHPDFINFIDNYYTDIEHLDEKIREFIREFRIYNWLCSYWRKFGYKQNDLLKFRLQFLNTSDSNNLQYQYKMLTWRHNEVWQYINCQTSGSYYSTVFNQILSNKLEKYLYGITTNSLMVRDDSYSYIDCGKTADAEFYNVTRYNFPASFNWINNYKIPFTIYKECIWSRYYPKDYFGNKDSDKKFILVRKIDGNTSYIYKPDGTYDTYDNTNYQTSTPAITSYLLTFNELQNILNTEGTGLDWFTGIYITPDDWIHINGIDEFKGIDAVHLTSGDYYLSDGTYKTLPANTNGYLWRPITGDIINLDDNTTVDTDVIIRDLPRVFRKDLSRLNTHLVNLPVFDKTNLTRAVVWHNPGLRGRHRYYIPEENNNKHGIDFDTGIVPNYIMERIIKPTFVDNISPSFVQDEFATFFLGFGFPVDILQIIDINVFRNIPFKEYYIGKYDTRLPKEVKRIDYDFHKNAQTEYLEIEQKLDNIIIPQGKRLFYPVRNIGYDFDAYMGYDYHTLDFSYVEPPDIVIPVYVTRRVQFERDYTDYSLAYIDIDYSDLDIEIDDYLIQNSLLLVYKEHNNGSYYKLPVWLELWLRDRRRLVFTYQLGYSIHPNFEYFLLFLYENPNVLYKDASLYRFVNDKRPNIPDDSSHEHVVMAQRCITGDAIFLRNQ